MLDRGYADLRECTILERRRTRRVVVIGVALIARASAVFLPRARRVTNAISESSRRAT